MRILILCLILITSTAYAQEFEERIRTRHVDLEDMPDALNTDHDFRYIRQQGSLYNTTSVSSATYTALVSDSVILANTTSTDITITLPTAVGNQGLTYRIKNIGTGTLTIDGSGSETIDDSTTAVLSLQYDSIDIISDNSEWFIL